MSGRKKNLKIAVGYSPKNPSNSLYAEAETPISGKKGYSDEEETGGDFSLWNTSDGIVYQPSRDPTKVLAPGLYEILSNQQIGLYFYRVKFSTENIIRFPDTESETVVNEIVNFWGREAKFKEYGISFKRGILLHGPPGSGKTSTIKLIIEDVINRNGVVIKFDNPELFSAGMRIFRSIQPDTPVVVLMEDIDAILEIYNESDVINILDGVDRLEKIVFLATTNFPEKLGPRIINRPSRFDRRYKIDVPSPAARKMYFDSLVHARDIKNGTVDVDKWVADTNGMSLAHLKELITSVVILGNTYEESLETLAKMSKSVSSEDGESLGFNTGMPEVTLDDDEPRQPAGFR